ncbi:hypothetical protein [Rhodopseudomonas palustris]|uniref:N,N-dimethylformamidase alpha subunit domain-containing protein n=1 Tax=Rhodopseudomonas palustris TaxID=1076 RepID=A0A418VJI4_RHOPL|nr:hypothetical protein [Rhodopseudomonas palustris]RJF76320.1 hypothetical protein D4Q52_06820 [Rhodopseudomonas palustris]
MNAVIDTQDRAEIRRLRYETKQREFLKTLVSPRVIEEHRRSPIGQHSEPLERLLAYFRRRPLAGRHAIMVVTPFEAYRLVLLSGKRGVPPKSIDETLYRSQAEAEHAIFLRNVQSLMEEPSGGGE